MIVTDETGFMPEKEILEGILPVGTNDRVAVLMVSTPGNPEAWMTTAELVEHPIRGGPLVVTISARKPCENCVKQNRGHLCRCNMDKRAPWKSTQKETAWKALYQTNEALFNTEILGEAVRGANIAFDPENIIRMTQQVLTVNFIPRLIYISVDPAEGGEDEFAICVMAPWEGGRFVVLYMDSFILEGGSRSIQENHLVNCINWLRSPHSPYRFAGIVYFIENNSGSRGAELAYLLRNIPDCITYEKFNSTNPRPGVPKTRDTTIEMVYKSRQLMAKNPPAFYLAADMGAYGDQPYPAPDQDFPYIRKMNAIKMTQQVATQLKAFQFENGRWSGKRGSTHRDDLAVAFMMGPYWEAIFKVDERYQNFISNMITRPLRG